MLRVWIHKADTITKRSAVEQIKEVELTDGGKKKYKQEDLQKTLRGCFANVDMAAGSDQVTDLHSIARDFTKAGADPVAGASVHLVGIKSVLEGDDKRQDHRGESEGEEEPGASVASGTPAKRK